jgi:hypothetical protein
MNTMLSLLLLLSCCSSFTAAWIPSSRLSYKYHPAILSARTMVAAALESPPASDQVDDDDDDYEYIEYESLTEADFLNSEWLVGTLRGTEINNNNIQETWVRLGRQDDGKNVCFWGTKQQGTWSLDVASQFLSISQEHFYGKEIWACTVDDYYYLQGTVRGWNFWSAASVYGQWQAKRLGVDKEEAGPEPWFDDDEEDASAPGSAIDGTAPSGADVVA